MRGNIGIRVLGEFRLGSKLRRRRSGRLYRRSSSRLRQCSLHSRRPTLTRLDLQFTTASIRTKVHAIVEGSACLDDRGQLSCRLHPAPYGLLPYCTPASVRENLGVLTSPEELIAKMAFSAGQERRRSLSSLIRIRHRPPSDKYPKLLNTLSSAYLLVPRRQVQYPPGSYTSSKRALQRLLEARGTKNLFVVS